MNTRQKARAVVLNRPFGIPAVKIKFQNSPPKSLPASDKRRRKSCLKTPFPAQEVCEYYLNEVLDILHMNEIPKSAPIKNMGNALLVLGVVCKEASSVLQSHPSYRYVCLFFNGLLKEQTHFLAGIPPSISLFTGTHGTTDLNSEEVRRFFTLHSTTASVTLRSALADRQKSVKRVLNGRLDEFANGSLSVWQYSLGEEGEKLPARLAWVAARARLVAQGLRLHRNETQFQHCQVCQRTIFTGTLSVSEADADDEEENLEVECLTSRSYWNMAGGIYPIATDWICCCSPACERAITSELETAAGIHAMELEEFDASHDRSGTSRVASALRAAVKRNQLTGRRMRAPKANFKILSDHELKWIRVKIVHMLNVDIGLLVACSTLCDTAKGRCRALPPTFEGWRRNQLIFGTVLASVTQLHRRYPPGVLIEHPNQSCRFLAKCRELAEVLTRGF